MLRRIVLLFLLVFILAVGALAALPLFVNVEGAREQIIAQVEQQTGMALRLDGDISVSAFPQIAVSAKAVGLAPSSGQDEILEAGEVRFGLKLLPLISGRFELSSLTLVEPEYTIAAGDGANVEPAGDSDSLPVTSTELGRLQVDRLGIERGRLTISARGPGKPTIIANINVTGALKTLSEPTEIKGSFTYAETDHRFSVTLADIAQLVDQGGSAANLELETDDLQISGTGNVWRIRGGSFDGRLMAEVKAVDAVLQSYGQSPLNSEWLSTVILEAEIVAGSSGFRLSSLETKIGETTATGDVSLLLTGENPELAAILSVDRIDLAKLVPSDEQAADADGSGTGTLDLSPFEQLDAEARLTIGTLENQHATLSNIDALIRINGGQLRAQVLNAAGLGGGTSASVAISPAESGSVRMNGKLALDGIDVEQAMTLAAVHAPVKGSLSSDLEFAASGSSLSSLRRSLDVSGSVSLRDGSVSNLGLAEHFSNDTEADRIDGLSVAARFSGLDRPLTIEGTGRWRNLAVTADATVDVNALLEQQPSDLDLDLTSSLARLSYSGTLSPKGLDASGTVSLETPSLVELARWAGQPIAVDSGLNNFSIRGKLTASDERIAFSEASISVDGSQGSGAVEANTSGAVPKLTGRLMMQKLDLTPYLGDGGGGRSGSGVSGAASGWSDAPIDFSGLGAINADFRLAADQMIWDKMNTGRAEVDLVIEQGVLSAGLKRLDLYDGTGTGRFDLRADGETPSFAAEFDLASLSLFSFLRDAADFRRIEGAGAIRFSVSGSGRSQRQFAQSLNGNGALDFRDGAIRGINIPSMVRDLTSGALFGWQESESQSTDFSSLTASFAIDRGRAETSDLTLIGPLVRLTGAGTVDVPAQTLSFRVDPKVVADLEGQGGQGDLAGLGVPVVVEGPWAEPRIYPDIEGILSNPQAALERFQKSGTALVNAREAIPGNAGEAADSLLNKLLGGGEKKTSTVAPDNATPQAVPQAEQAAAQSEQSGTPVAALPTNQAADEIGALIGNTDSVPLPKPRPQIVPSVQPVDTQPREDNRPGVQPAQPAEQAATDDKPAEPVQPAEQAATDDKPAEPAGQAIDLLQNLLGQ